MKPFVWILYGLAVYAVIIGLWDHSWQLIVAGVVTAAIWPLIGDDTEDATPNRERKRS